MTSLMPPKIRGIHHLKIAVSDLDRSLDFYERALGARRIPGLDHRREKDATLYAYICDVPGLEPKLELRLDPEQARKHACFDPITLAVADREALEKWSAHLDGQGILHSPPITSIQAWIIVFDDPDGLRLRLYTLERHGPELPPDENNEWLKT
jgi:catechol 2,3-dioxygenase-like lactoylglutathione lyase family enzyme